MKVVHVITGLADGGAEAVLYRLCKHDNNNHHAVISLMDEGKYGSLLEEEGIPVHCLYARRGRMGIVNLFRLWRLIRNQNGDIVQTWMYHADLAGGIAARLAGLPVVWGIHHSNLEPGKSAYSTIIVARICSLLSHWLPKKIICCSQRAGELHLALGYSRRKIEVIPNGYDLTQFAPNEAARHRLRSEWLPDPELPLLGMVARFDPQKDHHTLVSALGKIQRAGLDFSCVLVGAGMNAENSILMGWLESEGVLHRAKLFERRSDIPDIMSALDLHVLSSSYGEAFPNVLCEAMACGTPCVATDVGDAALIIGASGWTVPPDSPGQLAAAIEDALREIRNHVPWIERQRICRKRIQDHFSIEKMTATYTTVWSCTSHHTRCSA